MEIVVTENFTGRTLTKTSGAWTARRVFVVTGTASAYEACDAAVGHAEAHPDNPNMRVASRTPANLKGPLSWTVSADYRFGDVGAGADDPINEPPIIYPNEEHESQPFDFDIDGHGVSNSAGDPFDPAESRFIQIATFTITRVVPFYSVQTALAVIDRVNSSSVQIANFGTADVGQAYCYYYRPTEGYTSLAPYVRIEAKIGVKDGQDPWQPRIVDKGRWGYAIDTATGKRAKGRICDASGNPVDFDVRLNGAGNPLDPDLMVLVGTPAPGSPEEPVDGPSVPGLQEDPMTVNNENITVLIWKQKKSADFNGII